MKNILIHFNDSTVLKGIPLLLSLTILFTCGNSFASGTNKADEYRVKSAIIFNITRFIDWPPDIFPAPSSPLSLCVLGSGTFSGSLSGYSGRTVKGRQLVVTTISAGDDTAGCQLIVTGESSHRYQSAILNAGKKKGVITISDVPNFTSNGGTVGLVDAAGKIHFEINMKAAETAKVKMSSQLLKLAVIKKEAK